MSMGQFRIHFKPFLLACVCAAITFGCPVTNNTIVYVNAGILATKAEQDGTSWARAFAEIQDGIDAAQSCRRRRSLGRAGYLQ